MIWVSFLPSFVTYFFDVDQGNDALVVSDGMVYFFETIGRIDRMGSDDKEEVIGFFDAVVDLILEVDSQGYIVLVEPDFPPGFA